MLALDGVFCSCFLTCGVESELDYLHSVAVVLPEVSLKCWIKDVYSYVFLQ